MKLPSPRETLAGCVWLPRIIAKARLIRDGKLEADYASRFCHPTGVDGQFISFFHLTKDDVLTASEREDEEVATWFTGREEKSETRIREWNHLATNLGRPGFPMAERLPVALSTVYSHLQDRNLASVFEVLEADEETL